MPLKCEHFNNDWENRKLPDEFLNSTEDTKRSFDVFCRVNIGLTLLRSSLLEDGKDLSETCHIKHLENGGWNDGYI